MVPKQSDFCKLMDELTLVPYLKSINEYFICDILINYIHWARPESNNRIKNSIYRLTDKIFIERDGKLEPFMPYYAIDNAEKFALHILLGIHNHIQDALKHKVSRDVAIFDVARRLVLARLLPYFIAKRFLEQTNNKEEIKEIARERGCLPVTLTDEEKDLVAKLIGMWMALFYMILEKPESLFLLMLYLEDTVREFRYPDSPVAFIQDPIGDSFIIKALSSDLGIKITHKEYEIRDLPGIRLRVPTKLALIYKYKPKNEYDPTFDRRLVRDVITERELKELMKEIEKGVVIYDAGEFVKRAIESGKIKELFPYTLTCSDDGFVLMKINDEKDKEYLKKLIEYAKVSVSSIFYFKLPKSKSVAVSYYKPFFKELSDELDFEIEEDLVWSLRDYQKEYIYPIVAALINEGGAILKANTGWGKTVFTSVLLKVLFEKKVINSAYVLVPRVSLVKQWEDAIEKFCGTTCKDKVKISTFQAVYTTLKNTFGVEEVGYVFSDLYKKTKDPTIKWMEFKRYNLVGRTHPWLLSTRLLGAIEGKEPKEGSGVSNEMLEFYLSSDLVIFDEVHNAKTDMAAAVLDANKRAMRFGLSATPDWLRNPAMVNLMRAVFGRIFDASKKIEVLKDGEEEEKIRVIRVGDVDIEVRTYPVDETKFSKRGENYWEALLEGLTSNRQLLKDIEDAARGSKKMLILTNYITGVSTLLAGLEENGVDLEKVWVVTSAANRRKIEQEVKRLGLNVKVVNSKKVDDINEIKQSEGGLYIAQRRLLGEGWDDPKLDVEVIALKVPENWISKPEFKQFIGRLARGNKKKVLYIPSF